MQLSAIEADDAARTIHAALNAGVRWLDTANVYAPTARAIGHNERLIARALAEWSGPRTEVIVATKGGLTRKGTRWIPDGRAKHLRQAVEDSLTALGRDRIDVYQLHVADPKTAIETSVRALDALRRAGKIDRVGLCNVTVGQIEAARNITAIDVVQVELSVVHSENFESGVASYCRDHDIQLVAHRPLGADKGVRRIRRDPVLRAIADRLGVSAEDVALAWLYDLNRSLIVIPGATRIDTASRAHAVATLGLSETDRTNLDKRFAAGHLLRTTQPQRRPSAGADGDVVVLMGAPGAGKSSVAETFVKSGYARLNRDDRGGRLAGLVVELDALLDRGERRVVLDNTYPKRASRNRVIEAAWRHGVPTRCVWMTTSLEDAQVNAIVRMLERHDRLLDADDLAALDTEPNTFLPTAQFRYRDWFEAPTVHEGFESIDPVPFERRRAGTHRAIIVDADTMLWRSRRGDRTPDGPDDVEVRPELIDALAHAHADKFVLGAIAWCPDATVERVEQTITALTCALPFPLAVVVCRHAAGPPRCWCRRPLPGLGVLLAHQHDLDLERSFFVGDGPANKSFAARLSMTPWTAAMLLNRRARDRA